jgi:DNA-binding MarR family transcriptional regulator
MQDRKHNDSSENLTLLELVLQLHGEFRNRLEQIRVTPLQAGVILFLCRHAEANMTDTADAVSVRVPTLSEVMKDLVRKRWVIKRRSVTDTRVVHVRLSRRGKTLAQRIEKQVRQVSIGVTAKGMTTVALKRHRVPAQFKETSS